jgi:hypothetical protein
VHHQGRDIELLESSVRSVSENALMLSFRHGPRGQALKKRV